MLAIIGYGEMAKAIIAPLTKAKIPLQVVGRDEKKLKEIAYLYGVETASLKNYDITGKEILLAVKPYALQEVASQLQGEAQTLYSILAGTSIVDLHIIPAKHYIRAMPNLAAIKGASTTAITGDIKAKEEAIAIFKTIGKVIWVENEKELDIATAVAGSGPAFLALVAEAIADGAVNAGMKREMAYEFVKGLFFSFSHLTDEHPAIIKDRVMSPAGTTAAGIKALEEKGTRNAFLEAIIKAYERTKS
ncbi:pyrroline-5-carboxylate reductase [Nitratiruptor tergarcus]|uniref:Pyrroline-5-carboxylate reductase n=1 Tax=Nitratiruptor tergarcus DSM 16512 TaxID=1069081 RepID=A0A1W1WVN8_9BACT|nr:pyrroline-5-carboxylate reductase [Nitratiruptor tergarcus]SMC10100.1 pyrroline-5-carboxylate reductase [Nitratiruptor tergarcus DSM 16512]